MDKKKTRDIVSALALDYEVLFNYTVEMKRVLSNDLRNDNLETIIEKRGALLEKMNLSIKSYELNNESCNFTDRMRLDSEIKEIFQHIKQKVSAIAVLNEEIVSLIKQRINVIASYLKRIQEGKHYVNTTKMHYGSTPSLVDMCG